MRGRLALLILFLWGSVHASNLITASVTVTNKTTNGMTFVVNSDTRTFTNQVFQAASQVLTNADATGCGSKTNLFSQIGLNLFSQLATVDTGSNMFSLVGPCGYNFTVTPSAGYASVSYSTQVCATATPVGIPFANYYANVNSRTNVGSQLVTDLNSYSTNPISQVATIAGQLVGTTNTQTISGFKTFTNPTNIWQGAVSNSPLISGNFGNATNGYLTNTVLDTASTTNLINYGNALSSVGVFGSSSEQFGAGAIASGSASTAVGATALASAGNTIAIGFGAQATNNNNAIAIGVQAVAAGGGVSIGKQSFSNTNGAIAFGGNSIASGSASVAFGQFASSTGAGSTTIGFGATCAFLNSTAIGVGAISTDTNQVTLGAPGSSAVVPNSLTVGTNAIIGGNLTVGGNASVVGNMTISGQQTNSTLTGRTILTNSLLALSHTANSSLANGNNADIVIGSNAVVCVSGPSGAFTNVGFVAGLDGEEVVIKNKTGQTMAFSNQSGLESTAANRIRTGIGGDLVVTNNPGVVTIIYDATDSRWDVASHN